MSLLNLPEYPSINQIASSGGIIYQWTGSKWKRLDTSSTSDFIEYKDIGTYSGNTVVLDTEQYNYHRIPNIVENISIEIPPTSPYDTFLLELDYNDVVAWDISNASYTNKSFSVSSQDASHFGLFFKPDGTAMYTIGFGNNDAVYQYTLSTAWDLSTASYSGKSFSVSAQDGVPVKVFFRSDGIRMYVLGYANKAVFSYSLSTAWDVSTASYLSQSFSVAGQVTAPYGLFFKSDGTAMYVIDNTTDSIYQYTISTAWSVSTASYSGKSFLISQTPSPYGVFFKPDGTVMYVSSSTGVFQYALSIAWDVLTASYSSNSPLVGFIDLSFKPDGMNMFVLNTGAYTIYDYALNNTYNISWSDSARWAGGVPPVITQPGKNIIEFTPVNDGIVGRQILSAAGV